MYENVNRVIKELKKAMSLDGVDPTKGLPDELFVFSTTLVPIVNIDLFITNNRHQLLLSWRDDIYHGKDGTFLVVVYAFRRNWKKES